MPETIPETVAGADQRKTHHRVVALAYDQLCTFEFGIAVEVFALPRPEFDFPWYDFAIAAIETPIRAVGGFTLTADGGMDLLESADTIVIPGWRGDVSPLPAGLVDALRAAHRRGVRILSICSGAFVLAKAGLIHDKRATTHWRHAETLKGLCPSVTLVDDVLYVQEGNIVTSAGGSAGIDACLHLVRADHGAKIANQVARRLVMPPHRDGGQAQYVEAPVTLRPGRSIGLVLEWCRARLEQPLPVAAMAREAAMSERTFLRRFHDATGMTPLKWLRRERIHRAMALLEDSDLAIADIAEQCGFRSIETFRLAFRDVAGTSPGAYRKRFGADAAD
ncbi:MAG: transcriptional regulator FtrA [Alphaproteobacteria bacterium]|nr:transcriptional regulator FtrA [Alphaproteobacteria bacterium]